MVLVSGGSVAAIRLVAYRVDHAVAKQQLLDDAARTGRDRPAYTTTGPLNFLLLGSDFRSRTPTDGQRSDTIIVVHIPRGLDRAYLVSIPRDLRVVIPPFPATGYAGGQTKINAAYQHGGGGVGGTQLLSTTLTQLLGVGFDGAAIINFDGFRRAVDVLGGVTIHVDHRVTAKHLAYDRNGRLISVYTDPEGRPFVPEGARLYVFEPGFRRMTGEIALEWARTRYGLPGGDYDRQRHQQEFLRAMLAEAMAQDIVTNPVRLDQFVRAVGSSLAVDTNGVALEDLAFALRNVRPGTLVGVQVPSHPQNIGGVSYILQEDAAQSLYQAIRADNLDAWALENPSWVHRM
ncbi:MAG TPA: LCP family protein [Micromonosporaceae bacterium]|nr:LCP family protein [Micromonosporaceae bacterium]